MLIVGLFYYCLALFGYSVNTITGIDLIQHISLPVVVIGKLSTTIFFIIVIFILLSIVIFLMLNSIQRKNKIKELITELELIKDNVKLENKNSALLKKQNEENADMLAFQKEQMLKQNTLIKKLKRNIDDEVLRHTSQLKLKLEKSEENNRIKDAFLDKISREIRTPLNSILGFINLLNDPDITKFDREYYFKFIHESGNNLLGLIDNIIDFSKLQTGELKAEYNTVNLNVLLTDLVDKYRSRATMEKPDLSIIYHKPDTPKESLIDGKRALHIIEQLINNAVKFTKEGKVEVSYSITDKNHVVQIADTGVGIENKYQDIIFDRFYQIEPDAQGIFQGAGLGLTIAKGLTELIKGDISVTSEPGKGSVFTLTVPYKEIKGKDSKSVPESISYDWNDKTILIAEDEDTNYQFLKAILKKTKAKIIRADDGVKFLEIINSNKNIDMVLLDIQMPGINGFKAIKVVRQQNINVPVIAQTAFNQPEDKKKCLDSGCNDYLIKPIDRNLLLTKISRFFYKYQS